MKKYLTYALIGGIILITGLLLKGPSQDRSSNDYFAWKEEHTQMLTSNRLYQEAILNPAFSFDHLELVEVAPGKKYFSIWGHMMLRFAGSNPKDPGLDLVLSFLADFNDFPVDNFKASTGGYTVMPKIGTVKQYEREYIEGEGRKITFHPIHATIEQKNQLLSTLRLWINKPETPGGYSFFYNNCVSLMTKLLVEAKLLPKVKFYGYWPKYVPKLYAKEGLIDYE
ncbi:MAG: DUF4105 domain-containing protein [Bdellovibrionales bacterium]|nr:DUF4105 domain-containing protein [Bdellovibrionales bacterium]